VGHLAGWYTERPRRVEAVQLSRETIYGVGRFVGAAQLAESTHDVVFYGTPGGTLLVPFGDWVVRIQDVEFEVVPAPLFDLVYEKSRL
jgi:hypothetical protein